MEWQFWRRINPKQIDTCATIETILSLYGDGMASPAEIRQVEAHLAECDNCRRSLEWIEATRLVIAKRPTVEPPANLRLRIAQAIADAEQAKTPLRIPARPLFLRPAYLTGAVAASVLLVGYFVATHTATPTISPPAANGTKSLPPISIAPLQAPKRRIAQATKPQPAISSIKPTLHSSRQPTFEAQAPAHRLAHAAPANRHPAMLAERTANGSVSKAAIAVHAPALSAAKPHIQIADKMPLSTHRAIIAAPPDSQLREANKPVPSQIPATIEHAMPSPTIEANNTPPAVQAPVVAPPAKVMVATIPPRPLVHDDGLNSVRAHLAAFQNGSRDIKVALRTGSRFAASTGSQFVMLPAVYSSTSLTKPGGENH